jgi:hypothetical protein
MTSLTYRLEKLAAKKAAGKKAIVRVDGIPYQFNAVVFGGTSPRVNLTSPTGDSAWMSAADWRRLGAAL